MILYTVMPEAFVLAGLEEDGGGSFPAPVRPERAERIVQGRSGPARLVVEREPAGGWRVLRLVSSDPYDYLDPDFAPGRTVT